MPFFGENKYWTILIFFYFPFDNCSLMYKEGFWKVSKKCSFLRSLWFFDNKNLARWRQNSRILRVLTPKNIANRQPSTHFENLKKWKTLHPTVHSWNFRPVSAYQCLSRCDVKGHQRLIGWGCGRFFQITGDQISMKSILLEFCH